MDEAMERSHQYAVRARERASGTDTRRRGRMSTPISLHSMVTVTTEQVSCDLSGETVVLNLANGQYFGLNAVAARIWEMLQDQCCVLDVRDRLLTTYPDVDPERCTSDLLNVLADLAEADLVRIAA